jgi:hypothetical protein
MKICEDKLLRYYRKDKFMENRSGKDAAENDKVLAAELTAAGIPYEKYDFLRESNSEVKSGVIGTLYGWTFTRAWYYWVCKGPGIEVEAAERLHAKYGETVRVDGHCGCPSPRERFRGLACGFYHVDDAEGLKALADTIKKLVEKKSGSVCPDCGRNKAHGVGDVVKGSCPKWWAVRDEGAELDCQEVAGKVAGKT